MFRHILTFFIALLPVVAMPGVVLAQQPLLNDRWQYLETQNFILYSQVSGTRTERFARDLEAWRKAAASIITGGEDLPSAAVENQLFLFKDLDSFQQFASATELAFFYPTPRRNFMTVIFENDDSLNQGYHHYVHFLMRNFTNLRIPRWYEEGMAGYLANLSVSRNAVEIVPYSEQDFQASLALNSEVSLGELIYDEAALASPRLIQIANLKSETFLYFLLHGHEEDGFSDRRQQLQRYLELSLAGRSPRFAFDQAFDITTAKLDAEYERYLTESRRPQGLLNTVDVTDPADYQSTRADIFKLTNALAELAINAAKFDLAQSLYQATVDQNSPFPRSYSGLADSLRMQDKVEVSDSMLTALYKQAIEMGPNDPEILLDYGEYLETVLLDCELTLSPDQIASTTQEMEFYFRKVIEMVPDNAEANLAMAQIYLLEGRDYKEGIPYQRRAMELLPADTFVMEQTIRYKIDSEDYQEAEQLINKLSQPLHFWGEPGWVSNLSRRMQHKKQAIAFDACEHGV